MPNSTKIRLYHILSLFEVVYRHHESSLSCEAWFCQGIGMLRKDGSIVRDVFVIIGRCDLHSFKWDL